MNLHAGLTVMSSSVTTLSLDSYSANALREEKAKVTSGVIFFFRTLYRTY
jgi:hypothetical protein